MKVAILYICTGLYNQFFQGFYESCEKYLLKDIADLEYFVFTDDKSLSSAENVHIFERKCQGFPMDSLFRFDMFLSISEQLKSFDFVFFFNANMEFKSPVGKEFLPEKEGLMAVVHPGYYNKPVSLFPYERNKKSTAFIPREDGKKYRYHMGSLNGGRVADFLAMAEVCSQNTHKDLDNGIVAMVHDESHLNKYMSMHECLALSPSYAYPEGRKLPFAPKILIRDKTKFNSYFNKGRDRSIFGKLKKGCRMMWRAVIWYL